MPTMVFAPAGRYGGDVFMLAEDLRQSAQRRSRPRQGIEPEFQELRILERRRGPLHHLRRRARLDGNTHLSQLQPRAYRARRRRDLCSVGHKSQLRILDGSGFRCKGGHLPLTLTVLCVIVHM